MSATLNTSNGVQSPRLSDGSLSDMELESTESPESFDSRMSAMSLNSCTDTPDDSSLKAFALHVNDETIREKEQGDTLKARYDVLMACMKSATTSSLVTSQLIEPGTQLIEQCTQLIEQGTQWIEQCTRAGEASACLRKKRKRLYTMELAARKRDNKRPYQVENMSIG
jgi:hypothetical protein